MRINNWISLIPKKVKPEEEQDCDVASHFERRYFRNVVQWRDYYRYSYLRNTVGVETLDEGPCSIREGSYVHLIFI